MDGQMFVQNLVVGIIDQIMNYETESATGILKCFVQHKHVEYVLIQFPGPPRCRKIESCLVITRKRDAETP